MNNSKYIQETAPPISLLIRDKEIVGEFVDYLDTKTIAGHFLKKMYIFPEKCTLNTFIIVSKLCNERLDVVIRLAMEVTIPTSPFCFREDYKVPRVVKPTAKRVGHHPAAKKASKKNRVYQYIYEKGYAIRSLNTHMGGGSKELWERRFRNPRTVRLVDVVKLCLITRTDMAEVINFLLFGKEAKKPLTSSLYCRKEILQDIPLVLPNTSEFIEKNYANIVKCTIFKDATELNFLKDVPKVHKRKK